MIADIRRSHAIKHVQRTTLIALRTFHANEGSFDAVLRARPSRRARQEHETVSR